MDGIKKEELQLNDTVKLNKDGRPILGRLYGPCADIVSPTRNGRMYDEAVWDKVFQNPIVKEYFECGGIPGELDHPADRLETCSEKIAIMMPEPPKKNDKGQLIGYWDILDTPNGRIAYTLAKYGYKLGISSRGGGDTYDGMDGKEHVNEDTYDFQGFDLVLLPAVKAARLKMVESLQNGKTLKQALAESLDKATPDEKKVMTETLNNLKIDYSTTETVEDNKEQDIAANDAGANIVKDLQESLQKQQKLETQITELQEKLSVCFAKEAKYEEDIAKYKGAIRNLSEQVSNAKALQTKLNSLNEELKQKDEAIKVANQNKQMLIEKQEQSFDSKQKLAESLNAKVKDLQIANSKISALNESLRQKEKEFTDKENALNESIAEAKKNLSIKSNEYNTKLSKANNLVEQYRKTAKLAVNKYIESKATILGLSSDDIKGKLPSNYSFDDIDNICEDLKDYKLQISKLPFDIKKSVAKATITESKLVKNQSIQDDMIDDQLIRLAGLN